MNLSIGKQNTHYINRHVLQALVCISVPVLFYLSAQNPGRAVRLRKAAEPPTAQAARVALVIGNGNYEEGTLRNPCHDARAMKAALEGCRFAVTLLENANRRAMEEAIQAFGDQLQDGVVGLVYYAGHGLQVKGENYLLPIGARLDQEEDVPYRAVNVGLVLDRMASARNSVNILILDACRNNPFAPSWRRGGGEQGLAWVNAPKGSLVSYATAPGRTAADGGGEHGAYTAALLEALQEPGLRVEDVFKRVREKVLAASGGQQLPFESTSLIGDFYFRPPRTAEDCAREEAAVLAETRRLEEALKAQEAQAQSAERLRQEEVLKARLQGQALARERLAQEASRRLERAAQARKAKDEEDRIQEEARHLETLKHQLAQRAPGGGAGVTTLEGARREVERLKAQRSELLQHLEAQRAQALLGLEHDHAALRQRLTAPRDEFETTAQYQRRLHEAAELDSRIGQARAALEARQAQAASARIQSLDDTLTALQARRFPVAYPVALGAYDSDLGSFPVRILLGEGRAAQAELALEPARARTLKGRTDLLTADGTMSLATGPELMMRVTDPGSGRLPLARVQMTLDLGQGLALNLVQIPAGAFLMGAPDDQHEVTLTKPFWLGQAPVTQAQWEAVMGSNPSNFRGARLPVENVSWEDCQQFLARLNARGQGWFRLPTEAEWEYACRAGSPGEPAGDPAARAWYDANAGRTPHPVGEKQPNGFGLFDMNGNVWQWCQDWYGDYPRRPVTDPQGPPSGPGRVNRGGSWRDPAALVAPAHPRDCNGPGLRCGCLGFRLLMTCP